MKFQIIILLAILAMGCSSPSNNEPPITNNITNPKITDLENDLSTFDINNLEKSKNIVIRAFIEYSSISLILSIIFYLYLLLQ